MEHWRLGGITSLTGSEIYLTNNGYLEPDILSGFFFKTIMADAQLGHTRKTLTKADATELIATDNFKHCKR